MRVFLDTNVLVSAVATRGICADVLHTTLAEHRLVVGESVLSELSRVLPAKFRLPPGLAQEADAFLREHAEVVADAPALNIEVRDVDDIPILEQAVAGQADVLVTGDQDLLELAEHSPIPILSPRGFWNLLRSEEPGPK